MSKGLEALNEMRKYGAVMTPNCEIIEKELEVLEIIQDKIAYIQALNDRTKIPDNDLICFEIRGLVDKEAWLKIYEVLKGPVKEVLL